MVGIDHYVISHKLNVDPTFKPIKQKRRKFAPERNKVINDEVDNLLKTGKIREANVVVVQKKNEKWLVNMMFKEHLGRTMEVYIDDMLVKSERSIDHVDHLKQSFDILRQYKMKLNPTKCSFRVRAGKFLGYLVTQRGIKACPEQVKAITELQSPRNVKEVQKLTRRFLWTDEHEKALQLLKQYMVSPPLLTKPVTGESLQLYLAVSNNVTSAMLVREKDQQQRPIYYVRKSFLDVDNEAEYEALIARMDIAQKLGAKHLHVWSDSLLVVNQVNGDFQAKDSKMTTYLKIVKDWIARFDHFSIEQIPRDLNTQADALANLGSAFNDPSMESIPILHLMTPTIEMKEEVQMNEEVYNWSLDIWNYLKHDQLPEDKMEARKTRSKASRYTIFEDQLFRRSTSGLLLRCTTSKAQMNQILQEMHDEECGNHAWGRSLAKRISRQGYH
ncbi:hypothetical protein OSB04_006607 [Centaurea solstitialis]|uniref:Polyprotein n=1 Tax=Centaurea solstitialis TaxID=347529 RepID=A0AA38U1G8_9ASTR|nr:hypothetical protein OSB04_006607 [Centaurea solstitialis]